MDNKFTYLHKLRSELVGLTLAQAFSLLKRERYKIKVRMLDSVKITDGIVTDASTFIVDVKDGLVKLAIFNMEE